MSYNTMPIHSAGQTQTARPTTQPPDISLRDHGDFNSRWWTGPVDKVLSRLAQVEHDMSKELAVLVTTGALCPIHTGHIQMMETAKRELESRGFAVLGGYFCPDHDQYVSSKLRRAGHDNPISAAERLYLCEQAVADSDWLMVNWWAARYAHGAVSFMRILNHVSQAIDHNVSANRPINVVFVYGGDNAYFSYFFARKGFAVCVLRPGSLQDINDLSGDRSLRDNPRIIFSYDTTSPFSSTEVRLGDNSGMPDAIVADWIHLQSARNGQLALSSEPVSLYARHEGSWAVELLASTMGCDLRAATSAYEAFCTGLREAFSKAFSREPRTLPAVAIVTLRLEDQKRRYERLLGNQRVISLDPCIPGTFDLQLSRAFYPLSIKDAVFLPRHEAPPLVDQVKLIIPGNYVLFDDDASSGRTKQFATAMLEEHGCVIDRSETLSDGSGRVDLSNDSGDQHTAAQPARRLNHVNCRDFLAGAREGGICLRLADGAVCRAPCVLPYASPFRHASVPVAAEADFSRDVWRLNRDFFVALDAVDPRLRDMSLSFAQLAGSLDFPPEMRMVAFCDWHLERLRWSH